MLLLVAFGRPWGRRVRCSQARREALLEREHYEGPVWSDGHVAPALERALARPDSLTVLASGAEPAVVLGVPHHAPIGVERIALGRPEGSRIADENAALYALVCFSALAERGLPAWVVIASQAHDHDPNKHASSPYCTDALPASARLLLECHGAGSRAPHDLELSAGRNPLAHPLRFARRLASAMGDGFPVAAQAEPASARACLVDAAGRSTATLLRYPALRTRSLALAGERGVAALHLEAKLRFRSAGPRVGAPTPSGTRLGRALALALEDALAEVSR